jgi:hypothetical protein
MARRQRLQPPAQGAARAGGGGWAAEPAQCGGGRGELGRARRGPTGPKKGGNEEKEKVFPFFKNLFFLDECFHNFNQSKQMHGSAWCSKESKVL